MYRWFHPNLGNADAERLLMEHGQDGSFLVRHSATHTGYLSLSVRRGDEITHMRIPQTGDFFDLQGGEQFSSIAELVKHYTENPVKGRNGEVFELKIPLNCPDPTERWFHGSIKSEAADKLIREKGVNGSFLVRRSQRSLGDYVLTIRSKDVNSQADVVDHVIIRHQNNKYILCTGGGIKFDSLAELVEHYRRLSIVESEGAVYNMKYPFNTTSITALDFDERVNELSKENPSTNGKDGFCEEFEHIHQQECKVLFDRKIGQEDRNILKNRYRNILPYDYTRVILKKPISSRNVNKNQHHHHQYTSSQQQHQQQQQQRQQHLLNESNNNINNATMTINSSDSDYINANYIKLVNDGTIISPRTEPVSNSKIYIATQGPLPNTVHDFWLMVWQEKSDCIVMVTKEVERGKNKCFRYWPTIEQQIQQSGPIEVKILSETTRKVDGGRGGGGGGGDDDDGGDDDEDYTIREFELRYLNIGGDQNSTIDHRAVRRVVQYQYYAWQDQNTPSDPVSILSFLKDINRRPIHGPLIVHCSAGIGRTGALIVIDMLIDQLKYHGLFYEFDIQRVVEVARAQRSGLVQTVSQYKFIYLAIQRYIASLKH